MQRTAIALGLSLLLALPADAEIIKGVIGDQRAPKCPDEGAWRVTPFHVSMTWTATR